MASFSTNTAHRAGLAHAFTSLFETAARRLRERRVYRTTVTELSRLSHRELDDLGIGRGDIQRVAFEASRNA